MQAVPRSESMHIVRDPQICGGEPTVACTRVPVRLLSSSGSSTMTSIECRAHSPVDIPAINAALAFYAAHREEIDLLIEENELVAHWLFFTAAPAYP